MKSKLNKYLHLIGDIHGHATQLEELLQKLGYSRENGVYAHPSATAFFVSDFIDRGPQIREVLRIVKPMCDSGFAKTVMGNHEYNALCFHHQDHAGNYLRPHTAKIFINTVPRWNSSRIIQKNGRIILNGS